ncbi:hypothetical protein H0W91_01345 [Patescibacteria group bacterium]|nr:hypothetical protein [Patescibacteria group bacterium]
MFVVRRSKNNPIISPTKESSFDSFSAFNGNPIEVGNSIQLLYRAQSLPQSFENHQFSLSVIGKAGSSDGVHFKDKKEFIIPEEVWERFGLEDPRVTKIDGKYYIFYTALSVFPFSGDGIKVGVAISKDMKVIEEKHLVTPFNAKAMTLFPEKINGKYLALLSVNTDKPPAQIAIAEFDKIEEIWDPKYWNKWYKELEKHILKIPKLSSDQVEVGATPIKTKEGWLMIYSHIKNYFSNDKIFGIEALLLDSKNPLNILGKTQGPILLPEESYEKYGQAPNIVFPSGALVKKDKLMIYYGATDTTCAVAEVSLGPLLKTLKSPNEAGFKRLTAGPMFVPRKKIDWESLAVFNPAAIYLGGKTHILYRAMSQDNTSVVGYVESVDGLVVDYQSNEPIYSPRETFEEKKVPGGNSGCEDPRLTKIGDVIYMCYTAYNGITPPAVALTSITEKDFLAKRWNWKKPVLITKEGVDDKDGCLHPEKVKGKYFLYHRVENIICGDYGSTVEFKEKNNFRNIPILRPRAGMWDSKKVGMSVPPIRTEKGWILLYHGVSDDSVYRVGAILLDLKDPTVVLSRTTGFLFEPVLPYEKKGQVNNVVFPCGATVRNGVVYMYYGGGDSVVDVASMPLKELLSVLLD